jgi:hypothetical protein
MLIEITHASFTDATKLSSSLTELGAMGENKVLWRSSLTEVIARIHAGIRFFIRFQGEIVAIELVPSSSLRDAYLRTQADKTTFELLRHLPHLPREEAKFARW